MGTPVKIALRNLREHKSKTLIVGILIAVGILVLVIGNSLLDSANRGLKKSFIENYTAHIMVRAKSKQPISIVGGNMGPAGEEPKVVPEYETVYDYINGIEEVASAHGQIFGFGIADLGNERGAYIMGFGIEPKSYLETFPDNIEMVEGHFLQPGEKGLLLSEKVYNEIKNNLEITLTMGEEVKIEAGFGFGMNIRKVPLRGVYRFTTSNSTLQNLSFLDAQSMRALQGMVVGTSAEIELSEEEQRLLDVEDPDALFSEDMTFNTGDESTDDGMGGGIPNADGMSTEKGTVSEDELLGVLGDTSRRGYLSQPDEGAWHYILVRLHERASVENTIAKLNTHFAQAGIPVEAVSWQDAAGSMVGISTGFQIFFNIVVVIIAVVAIIIITNTLVISVIERTSEIGTMRALGAQKPFVRRIFILETMSISFLFGTIGLCLGLILLGIFNLTGIYAPNEFFELIFGSNVLYPVITGKSIAVSFLIMLGIGLLSSLYPVAIALKIAPIKAIHTE